MRIKDVFVNRKSALNFKEDFEMTQQDFDCIFELARYSPSMYNTQGTKYLVITEKDDKSFISDACFGQYKIKTASGVILVLHDREFMTDANLERIYKPMVQLGIISEGDYLQVQESINHLRNTLTPEEFDKEVYRNAYLNVGMLLSITTILGYDTCPMHIHNIEQIREKFNIPSNLDILFMVTIGLSTDKERPRGYRYQVEETVTYGSF